MLPFVEELPFYFVDHTCLILTLNLSVGPNAPWRSLHLKTMMEAHLRALQRNL